MKTILTISKPARGMMLAVFLSVLSWAGAFAQNCKAGFAFAVNGTSVSFTSISTGGNNPFYYWNFGDGNYNSTKNPVHSFNHNGTYFVCLTMYDSLTSCNSTFCDSVTITGGCNSLTVTGNKTNPSSSAACDGSIYVTALGGISPYVYTWSPNVSHTSSATHLCNGPYNITVTDAKGCTGTASVYLLDSTILQNCKAGFTFAINGTSVSFTNTSTGANKPVYFWNFGDGNFGWAKNPVHSFTHNGTYAVCLTMHDSLTGCNSTFCDSVIITGNTVGCNANIYIYQDSLNSNPLLWYVYSTITGTAPFTYLWNFGDGSTSTQQYPSHTYAIAGHYAICLTITDATGCSSSNCDSTYRLSGHGLIKSIVAVNSTTAVNDENSVSVNSVFPNPASGLLSVSLSRVIQGEIRISDITGREVYQERVNANNVKINVSDFPAGYYNLTIVSETQAIHSRILVAR